MIKLKEQFKHHIKKSKVKKIEISDYIYWELSGRDNDYVDNNSITYNTKEFDEWGKLLDVISEISYMFFNKCDKAHNDVEFFNSFSYNQFKKEIALFKLQNS